MTTNPPPPRPLHKAYSVSNIKAHVPLQLNLEQLNYDMWAEIFSNHCSGFDVEDHINAMYDPTEANPNNTPPIDAEWRKLDSIVKSWIYGTITPSLLQNIFQRNLTPRKAWLNLHSLFRLTKKPKLSNLTNIYAPLHLGTCPLVITATR